MCADQQEPGFSGCHGNGTYVNLTFNKVCIVNLLAAIFGDRGIKGFGEKGE